VSSSSSTDGASIATLLARALELMQGGCPAALDELGRCLADVTVGLRVDDESFDVRVEAGMAIVGPPAGPATVTISTSRAAVRAVLSGQRTLADAVRADAVRARGPLRDLVAVLGALEAFVHGAVRSAAAERLHDDFQNEDERVA
jgi:hypothetical protein